jgi:uncharacterized protein
MRQLIQRHPVASYFVLAVAISWTGILAIVLPGSIPASPTGAEGLFIPVYLAMLAGPSLAGLAVTGLTGGRTGLRAYRDRLLTWRVGVRWYATALLTAPVVLALTVLALSLASPDFVPVIISGDVEGAAGPIHAFGSLSFALSGLAAGLGAGFFEELGWTGVAVPRLLKDRSLLATGVGVGLVWGAWHFLAVYWGSADAMGAVPASVYMLVALFSFIPPYRILMAWVYQHTQSLLVAILMHASLTSSMLILGPAVSGAKLLAYDLTFGALFWIAAAAVVALEARRGRAPRYAPSSASVRAFREPASR